MVCKLQEFARKVFSMTLRQIEHPARRAGVVVVYAGVLMVEGFVEDPAADTNAHEHPVDEPLEVDKAMIEFGRDRSGELDLVCLEAKMMREAKSAFNTKMSCDSKGLLVSLNLTILILIPPAQYSPLRPRLTPLPISIALVP